MEPFKTARASHCIIQMKIPTHSDPAFVSINTDKPSVVIQEWVIQIPRSKYTCRVALSQPSNGPPPRWHFKFLLLLTLSLKWTTNNLYIWQEETGCHSLFLTEPWTAGMLFLISQPRDRSFIMFKQNRADQAMICSPGQKIGLSAFASVARED